jgi:hypothetical protein
MGTAPFRRRQRVLQRFVAIGAWSLQPGFVLLDFLEGRCAPDVEDALLIARGQHVAINAPANAPVAANTSLFRRTSF